MLIVSVGFIFNCGLESKLKGSWLCVFDDKGKDLPLTFKDDGKLLIWKKMKGEYKIKGKDVLVLTPHAKKGGKNDVTFILKDVSIDNNKMTSILQFGKDGKEEKDENINCSLTN